MKKVILSAILCFICTGCIKFHTPIVGNEYKVVSVKYAGDYDKKYEVKLLCLDKKSDYGTWNGNRKTFYTNTLYVVGDTVRIK